MQPSDSYLDRLEWDSAEIESFMMELLDASSIRRFVNDPSSGVFVIAPEYYWGEPDARQQVLQMRLKARFQVWHERFLLLFEHAAPDLRKRITDVTKFVTEWIEKTTSWQIEPTIPQCKSRFKEQFATFHELIALLRSGHASAQPVLVPDTNALIAAPDPGAYAKVAGSPRYSLVIVPTVTAELDKLKVMHRDETFRKKVNSVISRLKGLRQQGSMLTGVTVNKTVTVKMVAQEPAFTGTLHWLDPTNNDDRIIASVLEIQCANPTSPVILVTADINLQNKAEMAGIPYCEPPVQP